MSKKAALHINKSTVFWCFAPKATEVFLAGDFNEWNPSDLPMEKDQKGDWLISCSIPPGRYEYKFVIDGEWVCPEPGNHVHVSHCPEAVRNPFGSMNAVINVE